jgi:signal transduction histidine kinase
MSETDFGLMNQIYAEAKHVFGGSESGLPQTNLIHLLSLVTKSTRTLLITHGASEHLGITDGLNSWGRNLSDVMDTLPLLYQSSECTRISADDMFELQKSLGLDLEQSYVDGAYFAFEKELDSFFFLFFRDSHYGAYEPHEYALISDLSTALEDQVRFSLIAARGDELNTQLDKHHKRQSIWLEALAWLNEVSIDSLNKEELSKFYQTALFQLKMLVFAEAAIAYQVVEGSLLEITQHSAEALSEPLAELFESELPWRNFKAHKHHKISLTQYKALNDVAAGQMLLFPLFAGNQLDMVLCVAKSTDFDSHEEMIATLFAEGVENIIERMNFLNSIRKQNELLHQEKKEQHSLIEQLKNAQEQLMQQEKMASIGQLAAGVAHEINNPVGYVNSNINAMDGYIKDLYALFDVYAKIEKRLPKDHALVQELMNVKQTIDFDFIRDDVRDLIIESKEGVSRVRQIVKDLKDFSHVDEAEWQLTDIVKGIDSTLNIVHNEIKYKAVVHKEYSEIPKIECVPSKINQVVMNLLVNAGHAIEDRGEITIRVIRQDESFVCVQVQDTGSGIKPEDISHIFNPFFTTKPVGQGTGLGLSLSYSIIEKHGGELTATSELGVGTTFSMVLPINQTDSKLDG